MDAPSQDLASLDRIVVATDFSPASAAALSAAATLATLLGTSVTVVHVFQYPIHHRYPMRVGWMVELLRQDVEEKLAAARSKLEDRGIHAETVVIDEGVPATEILELLRSFQRPLLSIGTHADSGVGRFFLGSVAEEILRHATCPVLTSGPHVGTPPQAQAGFGRILYATDFSLDSVAAAPMAARIRERASASLRVLHVVPPGSAVDTPDSSGAERLRQAWKMPVAGGDEAEEVYVTVPGTDIAQTIVQEAERFAADLLVMGVRRAPAFTSHLAPGLSIQVIAAAPCAVLTVCRRE